MCEHERLDKAERLSQLWYFYADLLQASVVPLTNLLVREKGSTKDNRGFYLIRQSRENPEMYELVCRSSQERRDWIDILRKAVNESPEEGNIHVIILSLESTYNLPKCDILLPGQPEYQSHVKNLNMFILRIRSASPLYKK